VRIRLFRLCAVASLLLSAAACVLWVRGYLGGDSIGIVFHHTARPTAEQLAALPPWAPASQHPKQYTFDTRYELRFLRGRVSVVTVYDSCAPEATATPIHWTLSGIPDLVWDPDGRPSGRTGMVDHSGYVVRERLVQRGDFSVAWLASAFALPALLWAAMTARHRIHVAALSSAGRCAACGYDLRATPACCPECGAKPT
jgi:hypothetical protein